LPAYRQVDENNRERPEGERERFSKQSLPSTINFGLIDKSNGKIFGKLCVY
jgi:hypothetical protein